MRLKQKHVRVVRGSNLKKLYRYNTDYKIESVPITNAFVLAAIAEKPWGTLWRAIAKGTDFYGYALRKAAKEEAIVNLAMDISKLTNTLIKLRKKGKYATT